MTPQEALREIVKEKKWYVVLTPGGNRDVNKENVLRVQAYRILNGSAKILAIKNFFEYFGKEVEINIKDK